MNNKQTIVVTGASGFVGRWIVLRLLEQEGRIVIGTYRPGESVADLPDTLEGLVSPLALSHLQMVPADLHSNDDWSTVMASATSLIHTAAAVPRTEPKDRKDFITREMDSVERVLRAASAAGVNRVVMTSSMAAVVENAQPGDGPVQSGPNDWTDLDVRNLPAYTIAKTRAEKKAWDLEKELGLSITTICPGMVFGPILGGEIGASMGFLDAIANASIPKVPPSGFEIVDVRDVAEAHIAALDRIDLAGQRILLASGYRSMKQIAEVVQCEWPDRDIPTDEMPLWLVHLFARFIPEMRTVERNLGVQRQMDGSFGEELLKDGYISPEESIITGARSILELSE